MKNLIFVAPPAAGKGTQSDLLVRKYGYVHISTGDLLRNEIETGSELGNNLKEIMASGAFVSDEIVTELLKKRLSSPDTNNGFILDGYPRNINQALVLNEMLSDMHKKIDAVIYLEMDVSEAMKRALGRLTCPNCNSGYNKYEEATKPKNDNLCDKCNTPLVGRTDDNEETFKIRFNEYIKNTEPLINFYRDLGILNIIDNNGTPEYVSKQIESVL